MNLQEDRIKFLRKEAGITQIALSKMTGIPRHKIQWHEQGVEYLDKKEIKSVSKLLKQFLDGSPEKFKCPHCLKEILSVRKN